jgi:Sulfotransferase family
MREAAPILVAGLDHSGKTALRAALEAHPAIHIARHVELWTRLRTSYAAGGDRRRVVDALTSGKAAGLELDRDRLMGSAASGDFPALVREVGRQLCERAGTSRWGLQEALLEFQAAQVLRDMPEARVIHLMRDPRRRYQEMRDRGAVGRGGLAAETAAWIASARAASTAAAARPDAYLVLRYESLVDEGEASLRRICAFVGEPFDPGMAKRLPMAAAAESLPERDVAFVQDHAAPELVEHGYTLQPVAGRHATLPQRLADAALWLLGRLSWQRRARHLRPTLAWEGG